MVGLDGLTNLGKGILKIAIVGSVVWTVLWPERGNLENFLGHGPGEIASDMMYLMMKILIAALSVLAVIAVLDYAYQRYRFMERNRMSKQEIKEEYRQTDGDPAVKAKIKQIRIERSRRRMMAAVPEATVIITNPTHYAVALKYESGKMAAPICVAKGMDAMALKIREVAQEHEIPIVEKPASGARALRHRRSGRTSSRRALQGCGAGHRLRHAPDRPDKDELKLFVIWRFPPGSSYETNYPTQRKTQRNMRLLPCR